MRRPAQGGPAVASASISPHEDPFVGALLGDYRKEAWYTRSIDLCLLLVLALLSVLMASPTDLTGIAAKACIACVALVLVCAHVLWTRPFRPEDAWQGWVRALLLLDSVACAVLNALVSASDISHGGVVFSQSIAGFSILVFACCVLTFIVLIVGVSVYMYQGALLRRSWILRASNPTRSSPAHPPPPPCFFACRCRARGATDSPVSRGRRCPLLTSPRLSRQPAPIVNALPGDSAGRLYGGGQHSCS